MVKGKKDRLPPFKGEIKGSDLDIVREDSGGQVLKYQFSTVDNIAKREGKGDRLLFMPFSLFLAYPLGLKLIPIQVPYTPSPATQSSHKETV